MTLSLTISLVGLVLYFLFTRWQKAADPQVAEMGRIMFWVGLLAYLIVGGAKAIL